MESDPIYLLDAGNTRIKWGLHDGRAFVATGAVETAKAASLADALPASPRAGRALASNVAGAAVRNELDRACRARGLSVSFIASQAEQLGVKSGYRDPGQLGTDRWAALLAAHHAGPGHKL